VVSQQILFRVRDAIRLGGLRAARDGKHYPGAVLGVPVGIWIAYNQIKGAKEIAPMALAGHDNQSTTDEQKLWFDGSEKWYGALVKGGAVKPCVAHGLMGSGEGKLAGQ